MAGLLAWAADVVSGNGSLPPKQEQSQRPSFRFNPQQQDYVRDLDAQAAALQLTLQQLRQRIPPPDVSRSLPHLHAESLASHSALTMELNAHQATQKEAEMREASLKEENAAYAKAVTSGQQQVRDKTHERCKLEARIQEMEKVETRLRTEVDRLEVILAEKGCGTQLDQQNEEKTGVFSLSSGDKALREGEELQRTRAELKLWEDKLVMLEQEWATLLQNSTRWPSAAQREKELERSLRTLSEQLVAKQAQVDALTNERNALELRLDQINEARRQLLFGNVDLNPKRNKIGRFGLSSTEELKIHSLSGNATVWQRASKGISENLSSIRSLSDMWGRQAGTQLCSISVLHTLIVIYILGLHVIVFVIISFAG